MDCRENPKTWPTGTTFDKKKMTVTLFVDDDDGDEHEVTVAFKWVVCDVCQGKGSHVNPAIDAHGLSAEDFAGDPDFDADYFAGAYDQPCNQCGGKRGVPEPEDALEALEDHRRSEAEYRAEAEAERRMGC